VGKDGLPGGSSLARLLEERRAVQRYLKNRRPLSEEEIVAWARAHHARTGSWPTPQTGRVVGARGKTWECVDRALRRGGCGLSGGCSLGQFLGTRVPGHPRCPLTEELIGAWADAHHARTSRWPNTTAGPLDEIPQLSWFRINAALVQGLRGLPGGSSLAELLARRRGVLSPRSTGLTLEQILAWADAHHQRAGAWPRLGTGAIDEAPGDSWARVDRALHTGDRGLPGGSSLAGLLAEHRGMFCRRHRPVLTIEQILAWADAHHERTGRWPHLLSRPIAGVAGENWGAVNNALVHGCRGLTVQQSQARLLAEARGAAYRKRSHQKLPVKQVLSWARAHRRRTGSWPTADGGLIPESAGDTWHAVDAALRKGSRGLRGGASLPQLLAQYRRCQTRFKGGNKAPKTMRP
jgi:hypothetical protein